MRTVEMRDLRGRYIFTGGGVEIEESITIYFRVYKTDQEGLRCVRAITRTRGSVFPIRAETPMDARKMESTWVIFRARARDPHDYWGNRKMGRGSSWLPA